MTPTPQLVTSIDELEAIYPTVNPNSLVKETSTIVAEYRRHRWPNGNGLLTSRR